MNSISTATPLRTIKRGETWTHQAQHGPVWRVVQGVMGLVNPHSGGSGLVMIALPGDLIGTETLCAEPYAFSALALTQAELQIEHVIATNPHEVVVASLLQHQRQAQIMAMLRTGPVKQRLNFLNALLQKHNGSFPTKKQLPTLREMAWIVDSALETVCRELNAMRTNPEREYHPGFNAYAISAQPAWVARLG